MLIDSNFLKLISHDDTLNKTQFELLGIFLHVQNWQEQVLDKEIPKETADLLILLKGKLALKGQEVIVENYKLMLEFNAQKPKLHVEREIARNSSLLHIYCDGACSGNPGEAGSGLAVYDGSDTPTLLYGRYEKMGTNNSAELNAFYKALNIAKESTCSGEIIIFSDSKYSIDCITKWAYSWKSKAWVKKGGEIKNLEIIKLAHELYEKLRDKIQIQHVKGHVGVEGNELADRMAGEAITSKSYEFESYMYKNIDEVISLKRG
jgi:ribonuclease HI